MPLIDILWDLPNDPAGNVAHIAEHGLVPSDVEYILNNPLRKERSRSSGLPLVRGRIPSGELVIVVYQQIDQHTIYPITAYPVEI